MARGIATMTHKLVGIWDSGLAFDVHTASSTYLGVDENGYNRFDNVRSPMGELVYRLKYKSDKSAVDDILALTDQINGIEGFDFIVPIPPTNKNRPFQPVELIAIGLGQRRKVTVLKDLLENSGDEELKGITDPVARNELLEAALKLSMPERVNGAKVLLVDDLFRSGSTLTVATKLLKDVGSAEKVSVFTMTKTRSNR